MIICEKCGKENQDHYKFCLGCGAELPRSESPKPFQGGVGETPTQAPAALAPQPPKAGPVAHGQGGPVPGGAAPPVAMPGYSSAPPPARLPMGAPGGTVGISNQAAPAALLDCPQCGTPNPNSNRFCASCGYNLLAPAHPRPPAAAGHPPGVHAGPGPMLGVSPQPGGGPAVLPVRLVALRADGTEAGTYDLPEVPILTVGRDTGSIFAGDSYLSPRHATFTRRGMDLFVRDESSLNGVYAKLRPNEPVRLDFGCVFRIGQEIIRFEELKGQPDSPDGVVRFGSPAKGYIGRLSLVIGRDTTGNSFPVPERGLHCGRERGDVLFSEDGYVSGLHCSISRGEDGATYLTDVGSSNGTFLRLPTERRLVSGDILLMGQQLFRVDF